MAVSAVAGEKVRRKLEGSKTVLCGHPLSFILSITRNSGALLSLRTLALWSLPWATGDKFEFSLFVIHHGDQLTLG